MKKTKHHSTTYSLKTVYIFLAFVCALCVVSMCVKFITLLGKSKYGGQHMFVLSISQKNGSRNDTIEIIGILPQKHELSILGVSGEEGDFYIGKKLKIPIDARVQTPFPISWDHNLENNIPSSLFEKLIIRDASITTDVTIIDLFRLWFYTKSLHTRDIHISEIHLPLNDLEVDKISSSLFTDNQINGEAQSIQIINASDTAGLGNRLARLVTNIGGNVIAVNTSSDTEPHSVIQYSGSESYTIDRLSEILSIPAVKVDKLELSDIIIKIGQDKSSPSQY